MKCNGCGKLTPTHDLYTCRECGREFGTDCCLARTSSIYEANRCQACAAIIREANARKGVYR